MKPKLIALFLALLVLNCTERNTRKTNNSDVIDTTTLKESSSTSATIEGMNPDSLFMLESYLETNSVDTTKLTIVNNDCAVLIYPTDEQLKEMKDEYGEEDFYTVADDASWYQGVAIGLLDSLKIKIIKPEKPYIKFIGTQNEWTLNTRKKGLPEWNLIFFSKNKSPEIISTADITAETINSFYFK